MTRQKRIKQEQQIEALIYLFIEKAGYYDWREDYIPIQVASTLNCPVRRVKGILKRISKENHSWFAYFSI